MHELAACRQVHWSVKHGRPAVAVNDDICSACTPVANRFLQRVLEQERSRLNLSASSQQPQWSDDEERVLKRTRGTLPDFHRQPLSCNLHLTYISHMTFWWPIYHLLFIRPTYHLCVRNKQCVVIVCSFTISILITANTKVTLLPWFVDELSISKARHYKHANCHM